jgi:hypothetical protein
VLRKAGCLQLFLALIASVVACGGSQSEGISVEVGLQNDASSSPALGPERAFIGFQSLELVPCPEEGTNASDLASSAAETFLVWFLQPIGEAEAHVEETPTLLGTSAVQDLMRGDAEILSVGSIGPPPGSYCKASVTFGPIDDDALQRPDEPDLLGETFWFEGGGRLVRLSARMQRGLPFPQPLVLNRVGQTVRLIVTIGMGDGWAISDANAPEGTQANQIRDGMQFGLRLE